MPAGSMDRNLLIRQGGQMAADGQKLQGEVTPNPEEKPVDVEGLLLGFVKALIKEQASSMNPVQEEIHRS